MSVIMINKEKFEQDKKIKSLVLHELEELDGDMTTWLSEILCLSGEMAIKVDMPLYRKVKDLRDRLRSVL